MSPITASARRWLACLAACLLVALSFLPLHVKERIGTRGVLHGLGHLITFGVLSAVILWSSRSEAQAWISLCLVLVLGLAIEWIQSAVTGAHIERHDLYLDAAAVLAVSTAYGATHLVQRCLRRSTRRDL